MLLGLKAKSKGNVEVDVNCKDVNGDTSALESRPSMAAMSAVIVLTSSLIAPISASTMPTSYTIDLAYIASYDNLITYNDLYIKM